jgi:glycolate dehydrogenase iron-sulfur subunit
MSATAPPNASKWSFYDTTLDCVHCGLCLPACPTYDALGLETDSPRGRVHLMRAVAEGRIEDPTKIRVHLDQCLGCRACESACPSGVRYGEMLEEARGTIESRWPARTGKARLRRFLLRHVVARQGRLRFAFRMARLAETLGLRWLAQRVGLLSELSGELVPRVPPGSARQPLAGTHEPAGDVRGTVALFTGCVMEQVFGDLNRKTLELLVANGFRVEVTPGQGCCGALLMHDGQVDAARELATRNVEAFRDADVVIHNSAGCGAAMRDYGHLLGTDAARALGERTKDVCEFLGSVGLTATPAPAPRDARVTYDDPCHLCHGQGVRTEPRELLAKVPGIDLVTNPDGETCCGSAGIYNLNQPQLAAEIGRAKSAALQRTGATIVATGNPGCIMQIRAHLARTGSAMRVVHPVELLLPAQRQGARSPGRRG